MLTCKILHNSLRNDNVCDITVQVTNDNKSYFYDFFLDKKTAKNYGFTPELLEESIKHMLSFVTDNKIQF